jgi:hypothetical protein
LAAGASSGPFDIFTVTIAAGKAPGIYSLNSFTILGGPDGITLNPVGSTNFTVDVLSPVPEPGTLVLVGSGLLGLAIKHSLGNAARNSDCSSFRTVLLSNTTRRPEEDCMRAFASTSVSPLLRADCVPYDCSPWILWLLSSRISETVSGHLRA